MVTQNCFFRLPKTALTVIFLWANLYAVFAQPYVPYVRTGVFWDEFWGQNFPICAYDYGYKYWFGPEVTVQGVTYRALRRSAVSSTVPIPFCPPFVTDSASFEHVGLYREDTLNRKVYFYKEDSGLEVLWYDFNLMPGDTLFYPDDNQYVVVDSIGVTPLDNGENRRTLFLQNSIRWVEGIGNTSYFNVPYWPLCICTHGFCVRDNDVQLLSNGPCVPLVAVGEPEKSVLLQLAPNPAGEQFTITTDQPFDEIGVYDNLGREVLHLRAPAGATRMQAPVQALPRGLYRVQAGWKGNVIGRASVVKY